MRQKKKTKKRNPKPSWAVPTSVRFLRRERSALVKKAAQFSDGNFSQYVRVAVLNFKPQPKHFKHV